MTRPAVSPRLRRALALALPLALAAHAPARAQSAAEAATGAEMARLRAHPSQLYAFLREMPKGGDLHSHLSGAVYAESWLRWAAEDSLCVSRSALAIVATRRCAPGGGDTIPAAAALADGTLYGALVDAASMRNWTPYRDESGHDHFFATFARVDALPRRTGDQLAEAQTHAAAGRVSYLELMQTPDGGAALNLGQATLGDTAFAGPNPPFAAYRQALLAAGLPQVVAFARQAITRNEARRDTVLRCGTPAAEPGCGVAVRWLYQVGRGRAPAKVFAQILLGFELAQADPRVVGFNLVMPEDGLVSMRDYALQMRMIQALRPFYPGVKVSLHAGELSPGLVPPGGMRFHIRQAVEVAQAARIGHGVDVLYEDRPAQLMDEMAARGVMVEIALTSNDVILGVRGAEHPLAAYRGHGVPVALATDDEGVARSEMTREWVKAVEEQGLDYRALKEMARTSLEHAFVQGASLWRDGRAFAPVAECAPAAGGFGGARCASFAASSPRAQLQRRLELDFTSFEQAHAHP